MAGGITIGLLAAAYCLAVIGYIRSAFDDFGAREQMPELLIAFILAVGFIALAVK